MPLRALLRADLGRILAQAGVTDIVWLMPEESGYYQPVALVHNPGWSRPLRLIRNDPH